LEVSGFSIKGEFALDVIVGEGHHGGHGLSAPSMLENVDEVVDARLQVLVF